MVVQESARARPRDVLAALTLWIPFLAVAGTGWVWREVLPADLPRQWGADGQVNSTAPTGLTFVVIAVACLGAAVVAVFMLRADAARSRRPVFLGAGFLAGLTAGIWITTAAAAVAAGPDGEPQLGAGILVTLLGAGYGFIPYALSHKITADRMPARPETGRVLPDAENLEPWTVTVTSRLFAVVAAAVVLVGGASVGIPLFGQPLTLSRVSLAAVVLLGALLVLAFVHVRVSVDERGLRVASWLGVPLKLIPLHAIETVYADELIPMQWGGWGYRVRPGRSAFILGRGPGLVVQLTNGNQFAISLPDAETPADLLLAHLDRTDGPRAC